MTRNLLPRTIKLLVILIVGIALFAQERGASPVGPDHPLWKLDLGSAGLAKQANLNESPLSFAFVDSATLAVAWFVSHPRPSPGAAEPATLKVAYINASTGKERSRSEWIASSRPLKVDITAAGNLLVRTGRNLSLLSPELNPLQNREVFGLAVSPDGARALVCPPLQDHSAAQLLNTDTLEVLDTVPMTGPCGNYVVGDKSILAQHDKDPEVIVRNPGEPWHPLQLLPPASGIAETGHARYTFLNENVLAVNTGGGCSPSFSILTTEGRTLSTMSQPQGRCWGMVTISRGGQYFGVPQERLRGIKNEVLDMYPFPSPEQFVVYRLADLKEVVRVKVEGVSPWFQKRLVQKYAISPSGDLVAVMSNGVIRTYAVH
jgi:hypothetical protein